MDHGFRLFLQLARELAQLPERFAYRGQRAPQVFRRQAGEVHGLARGAAGGGQVRCPVIDPAQDQADLTRLVEVGPTEGFVLHPGEFVLGSTLETVALPDASRPASRARASWGRLGLLTHSTAGFVDPGFNGHVTLELSNVATLPIMLCPG